MSIKKRLETARNEKDVENIYREELNTHTEGAQITSPYGIDGLLEAKNIRSLLEFKYDEQLKNKLCQCGLLIQCLYYLKKFELSGQKFPSTIFVGDIDECFAIHTNSIIKYLSYEIDWKIAPSEAPKKNPVLIQAMVNDIDILPFVFDVDDDFHIKDAIEKIKDLSDNVVHKTPITQNNITTIFDYFDKYVLADKTKLDTNQKANLFMQIIINTNENYLHTKKKNVLITKSFGEIPINGNQFNSFFSQFEGETYSPKEKENLTGFVDRLVEDCTRRKQGDFFTPTDFVNLAHKYISDTFGEDWKEKYVVWDCAWGTGNLTRDYKFKELYCSTLEQSDIDTAEQMGYNPEGVKFQFDFLNDDDSKLPLALQNAINTGKEILFLINPPYATANNMGMDESNHKGGVAKNKLNDEMLKNDWGNSAKNLYAQFLFKIFQFQQINKNIKIGLFSPPLFLSGGNYNKFRLKFLTSFGFEAGFLFEAQHFSDVAKDWGISFTVFNCNLNNKKYILDIIELGDDFLLNVVNKKEIYNTDNILSASEWVRKEIKKLKNKILLPHLSSFNKISNKSNQLVCDNIFGTACFLSNSIYKNGVGVSIFCSTQTQGNANISLSIIKENFFKMTSLFAARKIIQPNWINCKDEYLAPNEQHPDYEQFTNDSIVYSLFNNSSQQSSLRQIEYKDKLWDIKNEFFWLSKEQIEKLANDNNYDELYRDAKNQDERFVYNKLFGTEKIYDKLSPDAKKVLDIATELLVKSISMRKLMSEEHPEYHLNSFDAGYAQLKLVWKQYFKDEFKAFRTAYNELETRMRPLVYELGFLKK
jgi:hypothetical protein